MQRLFAFVALLVVTAQDAGAQVLDDALVPRGLARVEISPVFTSWGSRFGRLPSGEARREELGEDLTAQAAHTLFPGADALRSGVEAMTGTSGYAPTIGELQARITKDITRVEFGAYVGVFDWLTIGAMFPLSRSRTNLDLSLRADTLGGLGINPTVTSAGSVSSFLGALAAAETAAQTHATQVCGSSPGSPACTSAQALSARASAFHASADGAYNASAFFPFVNSPTATALLQSLATLSGDLIAAGLPGISAFMPFATEFVSETDFFSLPQTSASGVRSSALGSVKAPWNAGDMELSATARLLDTRADEAEEPSGLGAKLFATALVRLPTGATDYPDTLMDVGSGDRQLDVEGRLLAQLTFGRRLGVHVGGRYGVQSARTLVLRVAPPETVLAPAVTRALVRWTPGAYYGVEIAPVWQFTSELTLVAEYRAFRKPRDTYEVVSTVAGSPPVDPTVLEIESGVTLHEVGGALRYDTLWRLGAGVRPLQVHMRVLHAVAGGGGQTPVTTQVELGVRLFRRIWGG
jgi:hypothetical protein